MFQVDSADEANMVVIHVPTGHRWTFHFDEVSPTQRALSTTVYQHANDASSKDADALADQAWRYAEWEARKRGLVT